MVGLFTNFSGNFTLDPENVAARELAATIKTDSLQTQFSACDKDLKGADWFDVTEFPEMTFVGTGFAKKESQTGSLTLLSATASCVAM